MLIQRRVLRQVLESLIDSPAVLVEGPPRSGKSVLAAQLLRASAGQGYLVDALSPGAANFIQAPAASMALIGTRGASLLIVDNADRDGRILELVSQARPEGRENPLRVVLIGSAFPPGLAIPAIALSPLSLLETGRDSRSQHWLRGGYPEALFAHGDAAAFAWLSRHVESLAESRLASAGLPWAPGRTRRLLAMLAREQGDSANENAIARSLGVTRPTVMRSIDALEKIGILATLPSLPSPNGKRTRLSGVLHVRDSGLLHTLLGVDSPESLLASPLLSASWEGYAIEQARLALPSGFGLARYRTQDGAGLELVVLHEGEPRLGASIRWARAAHEPLRGARLAAEDLGLAEACLVLPEADERDLGGGQRQMGLARFLDLLSGLEA